MPKLPLFKDQPDLMQQRWKSQLDPILSNSLVNGKQLSGVNLVVGSNQIPHGLSSAPAGWFFTDINGTAKVFRSAPFDSTNLTLTSDSTVTVNIWVY